MSEQEFKSWGPFALSDYIGDSAFGYRRTLRVFGIPMLWPWPLAERLSSSGAIVLGYPIYGDHAPKVITILAHKVLRPASNALCWLRYRIVPKHKYHLVRTGLEPGYYDQDTLMLHACMAILGSYIEEEGGIEAIRSGEGTRHVIEGDFRKTVLAIWDWWKVGKPADENRRDALLSTLYGKHKMETKPTENPHLVEMVFPELSAEEEKQEREFRALEKKIDDDEQAMLHRLIDIRRSLWS